MRGVWVGGLLAASAAVLLGGVALPLTDGDTALYASVARDALSRGEWVVYRFADGRVFDKPPLTLWLLQVSLAAWGPAEWAVRLWHLGLALATALVTYGLARLALDRAGSALAALILLSSAQFFYQALTPQQDVPLALFVALAVYGYLRWEQEGASSWAAVAGASVGLAVLSKGLVGLVLPALVGGVRLAGDRPRLPARWPGAAAVAVGSAVAVAAPWFVVAGLREGREFVQTFVGGGTLGVGRFFHPVLSAPGALPAVAGLFAYLVFLPLGLLPWTGWLWPALRDGVRQRDHRVLRVCVLWVASVVVFLSVSPGDKVIRFQLPVLPAAAVLLAHAISKSRGDRVAAGVSAACAAVLSAATVAVLGAPLRADLAPFRPMAAAVLLPLLAGLALAAAALWAGRKPLGLTALVLLALVGYGLLEVATARQWDRISPWRPLARMVAAGAADASVLVVGQPTPFAQFYLRRPVRFVSSEDLAAAWTGGRVVAVLPVDALASLPSSPGPVVLGGAPGRLVVVRNF